MPEPSSLKPSQRGNNPPFRGSPLGEPGLPKTGKGIELGIYLADLDASSKDPAESGNLTSAPNEN
ncbi:MAG: hypothetical protein AAF810_08025 [Cyanobacteria bacterium P01_D01_bin.36]